jgi:hypothetical protein
MQTTKPDEYSRFRDNAHPIFRPTTIAKEIPKKEDH